MPGKDTGKSFGLQKRFQESTDVHKRVPKALEGQLKIRFPSEK